MLLLMKLIGPAKKKAAGRNYIQAWLPAKCYSSKPTIIFANLFAIRSDNVFDYVLGGVYALGESAVRTSSCPQKARMWTIFPFSSKVITSVT